MIIQVFIFIGSIDYGYVLQLFLCILQIWIIKIKEHTQIMLSYFYCPIIIQYLHNLEYLSIYCG